MLSEEVSFLNRGRIMRELKMLPDGARLVLDRSHVVHMDPDVEEALEDFQPQAEARGIELETRGAAPSAPRV